MRVIPLSRPLIEKREIQAVKDVLKSGWLTHGPKTAELESIFAKYIDVEHAIAMNSCTSALFLSILANDIKGEVLVPSFTFVASANAIKTAGAKPVFVDINYHDCNIDADMLEMSVTDKTEAIMVVHYAGQCCEMDRISMFAKKHDLLLIEDSAETIGGMCGGKKSGSWGIGCFSFFPTKNMTTGEGGLLTTNDDILAHKVRMFISHGISKTTMERSVEKKSWHREAVIPGYNFRLSNILAAIGVEQLVKLDRMNDARRANSHYLIEKLQDVEEIDLPLERGDFYHVYQMFTIKIKHGNRNDMIGRLKESGIEASVHFDPPVHKHPAYSEYNNISLPVTEKVSQNIITLPMYPHLKRSEMNKIIKCIKDYFSNG